MAALTRNGPDVPFIGDTGAFVRDAKMAAAAVVFANSFVGYDNAGGLIPVAGAVAFAGVAKSNVDNAEGNRSAAFYTGAIRIFNLATPVSGIEVVGDGVWCATDNPADCVVQDADPTLSAFIGRCIDVNPDDLSEITVELAPPGTKTITP